MARTRSTFVGTPKRCTLQISRREAEGYLQERIGSGQELLQLQIDSRDGLERASNQWRAWYDYNRELLRRIVDGDDLDNGFKRGVFIPLGRSSLATAVEVFCRDLARDISRLESILKRLDLIPESPEAVRVASSSSPVESVCTNNRVFIVHGHDEAAMQTVARCVEKLGLEALILHEQANEGRTIIEKFEDCADVDFVVVLLTPDDVGASSQDQDSLQPRARQNVILELGFFLGRLGRDRVCALHKDEVEIPSDFSGVLWVPMDSGGAWRLILAREMKAAGFDVDLNDLA